MASRPITALEFFKLKESSLGERIRFFRGEISKLNKSHDFSTRAIAKRIGMTAQSITAVERGDSKNPSYQLIYAIAKDLKIPLEILNDEYYQGDVQLFTIGTPDYSQVNNEQPFTTDIDPALTSNFRFGCYVYQVFKNGQMRFLYNKETTNPVDYQTFVYSLSRFISEIEIHSKVGDILESSESHISPLDHATDLFKASIMNPVFPMFTKNEWNQVINAFLDQQEKKIREEHKEK